KSAELVKCKINLNKKYEKTKDENITNLSFAFSLAIKQLNAIGDASEHPEPESQSNPWVENWGTLLS
ncbi:hypothetical protein ONK27_26425, partial [Salmonella enterica subsp. enterica serovar Virginia]|nr:hypothetical protein [Salmonella enterica subsp. enterica serovar Virginia]